MWTAIGIGLELFAGGVVAGMLNGWAGDQVDPTGQKRKDAKYEKFNVAEKTLWNKTGVDDYREFDAYLRDAQSLGIIDGETSKNVLNAYSKYRSYNYDREKLSKSDIKTLTNFYNTLYNNDSLFKSYWDDQYTKLSPEDKEKFIKGVFSSGAPIPAPAYLDTNIEDFQKKVAPLKVYTNKELAELYNIDYDFDNIKAKYEAGAQADVDYSTWMSDLLKNAGERDNAYNQASYLDAIRDIKSESIINGISNGARAAAEVLANREAVANKVQNNTNVATQRFGAMNDALLKRAQVDLNTANTYTDLFKALSTTNNTLYANDVNRLGQDLLANANFRSSDLNLRANREAANMIMAAAYNAAKAQNDVNYGDNPNSAAWLFKNVYLPASNDDVRVALSRYLDSQFVQNSGYRDTIDKWGSAVTK